MRSDRWKAKRLIDIKCLDFESGGAASADQKPRKNTDQVHERANAHCREAGELQPGEL